MTIGLAAPSSVPLVGRERELTAIRSTVGTSGPDGRVVLLEGEAGIGKTRLAETVSTTIRADNGIVLAARGYPGEGAIAYGPIAELLRAGLATPDAAARLETLDETARLEIGRLVDLPAPRGGRLRSSRRRGCQGPTPGRHRGRAVGRRMK